MTANHEKRPKRVSEAVPVQVYLARGDSSLLERLTAQLEATKSEVIRRALAALEAQLLAPAAHPALRVVGLVDDDGIVDGFDPAVGHDHILTDESDVPKPRAKRRGKS